MYGSRQPIGEVIKAALVKVPSEAVGHWAKWEDRLGFEWLTQNFLCKIYFSARAL